MPLQADLSPAGQWQILWLHHDVTTVYLVAPDGSELYLGAQESDAYDHEQFEFDTLEQALSSEYAVVDVPTDSCGYLTLLYPLYRKLRTTLQQVLPCLEPHQPDLARSVRAILQETELMEPEERQWLQTLVQTGLLPDTDPDLTLEPDSDPV